MAPQAKEVIEALPGAFLPDKAGDIKALVQFTLTGDGGGSWAMEVADGKCDVREETTPQPDVTLTMDAADFEVLLKSYPKVQILDVRRASEYASQHLPNAKNAPLDYINESSKKVDPELTAYVHCAGGYRSMTFISVMKARGFHDFVNINGGMSAIKDQTSLALTDYVEPTTML